MKKVLCLLPLEQRQKNRLEKAGEGCSFAYSSADEVTADQVSGASVIIGNVPPELIKGSEKLELLQLASSGADAYVKSGILSHKTALASSTGAYSKAVAEHGFASTLMLQKKLHLYRDAQKRAEWSDFGTVSSMTDATVLVVGLGEIGRYYASLCRAMGARVIGIKRRASAKPECVDELYTMDRLEEVLPEADVVFSILPGTPATFHLYTEHMFSLMKKSAIFINCGRGTAVELSVLYKALKDGEIASAAIDVAEIEPLPADNPLWHMDNILITPHASGYFHLPETLERIVDIASDNLERVLSGRELRNIVDLNTGYRK